MTDRCTNVASRRTILGILKLQLLLAPLCCAWLYAAALAQERQVSHSTSLSFLVGLACTAIFYATFLSVFRLRAFSNDAMFVPALKYGLGYSLLFGLLAWSPSIAMDLAHAFEEFLPKFFWLRGKGELNSLLGCQMALHAAWTEFHRPLSSLPLLFGFYGFLGLVTGVFSTTLVQIARWLLPQRDLITP